MFATGNQQFRDEASEGWGWYVAFGVALVIVGLIALWNAVDATLVTTIIVGWLLVIGGVVELGGAFSRGASLGSRIWHVILGLLYLLVGFDLIFEPISGTITLAIAVGILLIVDGIIRLWVGFTTDMPHRWLLVLFGVIDILFGIWLLTNIPVSAIAIGVYVGVMLLMAGITWIAAGWMARPTSAQPAA